MRWIESMRNVKITLVVAAVIIAVSSLVVSHFLVRDLAVEERNHMEVWSEAMRSLNSADDNTDLQLVLKVIEGNHNIPLVVLDSQDEVQIIRNVEVDAKTPEDSIKFVDEFARRLKREGEGIRIDLEGDSVQAADFMTVYYDESLMIRRLSVYPYVQLSVVLIFVFVAIFALLSSKRAEQNKVWVGLSKETAHQLGTPISSLMAWVEVLKESYPEDELIEEMGKDVNRLQRIAERFSKIGSLPECKPENVNEVIGHVAEYIGKRTSNKVRLTVELPPQPLIANICAPLFEWVIENLCKNAIDAMEGHGSINILVREEPEMFSVEVSDTGKGIPKNRMSTVFRPGYTTKARGWGLGLALCKRIVEEYHHGSIYVKSSELGHGTTFRVEMKTLS